jgi:hypothetical protein
MAVVLEIDMLAHLPKPALVSNRKVVLTEFSCLTQR